MNELMEKIKRFFSERFGKKQEVALLSEGKGDSRREEQTKKFKEGMICEVSTTSYEQEINNAIKRHKDLEREGIRLYEERKNLDEKIKENLINELFFSNDVLKDIKVEINKCMVESFASDETILEGEKREELIEKIKSSYESKSTKTIEEYLTEKIRKYSKYSSEINNGEMSLDQLINESIELLIQSILLDRRRYSEINAEKVGIAYALTKSINKKCKLPKALTDKYEDTEDFQNKKEAKVKESIGEARIYGTLTPSEDIIIEELVNKDILDRTAVMGDDNIKDIANKMVKEDIQAGRIKTEATQYHRVWLKTVIENVRKGVYQISVDNKSNMTYIDRDDNGKAIYLIGEKQNEHSQENIV